MGYILITVIYLSAFIGYINILKNENIQYSDLGEYDDIEKIWREINED